MKTIIIKNEINIFTATPKTKPAIVPKPAFSAGCAFLYLIYSAINAPIKDPKSMPIILNIINPIILPIAAPKTPTQLAPYIFAPNTPEIKSNTVPIIIKIPVTITTVIVTSVKSVNIAYNKIPPHITGRLGITGITIPASPTTKITKTKMINKKLIKFKIFI